MQGRALAIGRGANRRLGASRRGEQAHRLFVRRAAEDVQAVADAELLDVAKLGVELGDGLAIGLALYQTAVGGQPVGPGALDDLLFEEGEAAAVEAVGRGIFLDDAFELGERPMQAGRAERRRQMADGDGAEPPLGLHRLTRIVDDEGIDHRQRPQHDLGPALGRQCQRLAGQPFQGAMRAKMDQRIDLLALAQPSVGRDVGVARRAARVVVTRLAIAGRAAIGLQQHQHLAAAEHGQAEGVGRFAPGLDQLAPQAWRQRGRRGNLDVIDSSSQQALDVGGMPVASAGVVAFGLQQSQDLGGAGGGVEADGIAGAPAARRIIRQHERQASFLAWCAAQFRPGRRQLRHVFHAIGCRLMAHAGEFQARIGGRLRLEGDGAGQQPAVELGQHDVHGEIGGRQAALGLRPGCARAAGQHDLQHRRIGIVEHRRVVLGHGRKGCGVEDDRRLMGCDQRFQLGPGQRVLEAVHRDGKRRQPLAIERLHQRRDRRGVRRHQIGAIEDDQRHRTAWLGAAEDGDRADRHRRRPGEIAAEQGADIAQRLPQILRTALAEEAVESRQRRGGEGRDRGQTRIGAVVTRQGREQDAALARGVGDVLQAVAPIVKPAQAAHDDHARAGDHALDIEIDRHRML